tara:strand:- start:350 stop:526 length:177 start_codon:yes stop_codon:yes gene_type:complete
MKEVEKQISRKDRYVFSNGKTSYEYAKQRALREKERKRVNRFLSVDFFSNKNSEVNYD